jgi:hypothetical protein
MNADGSVHAFAANTFIGHLGQQGEDFAVFDALLNIYREFPCHSFHQKIALLPPSSYHITVFGGLNEADRGSKRWSQTIARDMSMEQATERYLQALRMLPKLGEQPFQFEVDFEHVTAPKTEGSLYIALRPVDLATERRLQAIRNQLADLTGLHRPDHDHYSYHVTIGYFFKFLDAIEAQDLSVATAQWMQAIAATQRKPRITSVQFCRLRDMYAYEELHRL